VTPGFAGYEVFRGQLLERRDRLLAAASRLPDETALLHLLGAVDTALERIEKGTYGLCESCQEPIETDRLLADPLICFCLDHLNEPERRELERDLELAARIQANLLPDKYLRTPKWHATYFYKSAGPVSGDYCDVVARDASGAVTVLVGDVSGKGVAASLLMSHLHAIVRTLLDTGVSAAQLMQRANQLFCRHVPASQFATLVCAHAGESGEVEIVNAGHCPALLLSASSVTAFEASGLPLGMFSDAEYQSQTLHLAPGDCLLLHTDGLVEAVNGSGAEYGNDRIRETVSRLPGQPPGDIVRLAIEDLEAFLQGEPLQDDVTILVLRRSGELLT